MEKIKQLKGDAADYMAVVLRKQDEIIDWINEHEQARGEHDPK